MPVSGTLGGPGGPDEPCVLGTGDDARDFGAVPAPGTGKPLEVCGAEGLRGTGALIAGRGPDIFTKFMSNFKNGVRAAKRVKRKEELRDKNYGRLSVSFGLITC